MANTQTTGVSKKEKAFLRVWRSGGLTHYYARIGSLEFEGSTPSVMYKDDVKKMIEKALEAQAPLPDNVVKAIDSVVNHLVTVIRLGATTAAAHAGFDFGESMGISFTAEMYYGDNGTWAVEVRVVHEHNGWHRVVKRVVISEVTAYALREVITEVVRQAYSII
jgi:hypothetical protein